MTDWTKKPIGSARTPLAFAMLHALGAITKDVSAADLETALKKLEKAIAAFRDNER